MRRRAPLSVSHHGLLVAGFLAWAMVLGGGGSPSPKAEIIVQIGFVGAVIAWLWWARRGESAPAGQVPRQLVVLGCALLAVPLVQLVPLPLAIWQALPGRELEAASLALVGAQDSWRPLTISAPRTLAGLLALVPAVGLMWATATLGSRDRRAVVLTIALVAIASAVLGALQLAASEGAFQLYEKSHRGWLTGFHSNRNAAVDVLLIGSLALSAWFAGKAMPPAIARRRVPVLLAGQAVLLLAAVLTGSRAGILLILPVLALNSAILAPVGMGSAPKWVARGAAGIVLLLLAMPLVLAGNQRLAGVASRFDVTSDARLLVWRDTLAAIEAYFPVGGGVGTFPVAFTPYESFESLAPPSINRAHNDYLELLLEMGIGAPVLLVLGAVLLVSLARMALRESPEERTPQFFALGVLGVIALHSLVDYPMRNMAIACLAGVAAGLLGPVRPPVRARRETEQD